MNAVTPEVMRTPKHYWQIRRNDGHSDWTFGFWRELFQNEVDAGAKNISITVSDADGKGSFGRDPTVDRVLRVTFSGDGKGMDEKVIREVFLRPGESTKRGTNAQGGFGTARIMLAFSQVRYGIRTQDLVVEGDGSEYTCLKVPQAVEAKLAELRAAEAARDAASADLDLAERDGAAGDEVGVARVREASMLANRKVEQARADLAALQVEPPNRPGARFEIDIDPQEHPDYWRNVTRERLLTRLDEYLSMSQLPCKVSVNGEAVDTKTLRGPAKRKLVAKLEEGREVDFGTIHTSQGERARHKGKIIVRSGGAAMFSQSTSGSVQVIVELDPAQAKLALTDNRDGMKEPYRAALDGFVEQLVVDTKSALDDKDKRRHIVVKGGLGTLRASLARVSLGRARVPHAERVEPAIVEAGEIKDLGAVPGAAADKVAAELPKASYTTAQDYEVQGFGGVPKPLMDRLIEAVAKGEETVLDEIAGHDDAKARFVEAARAGSGAEALREVEGPLADRLAAAVVERMRDAGIDAAAAARAAKDARLSDINDVHIQLDDVGDDEKIKNAARRHNPSYWRRKGEHLEGRGMEAHMLYAAWTACVTQAVRAALAAEPSLAAKGPLEYATGWYFGRSQERWIGDRYGKSRTAAQHQEHEGTHLVLLNPIFEDGRAAFDLTKLRRDAGLGEDGKEEAMGLQDLVALAVHEVCHIFKKRHDEDFAGLMTRTMAMFDQAGAFRSMRDAVDAARAAYGRGRTRIQALDGPELDTVLEAEPDKPAKAAKSKGGRGEIRPAERLLAHAAPIATMVAGAALAAENEGLPVDALRETYVAAFTDLGNGVTEVNCDVLQGLDRSLAETARAGWESPLGLSDAPGVGDALPGFDQGLAALAVDPGYGGFQADLGGLDDALAALAGSAPGDAGRMDDLAGLASLSGAPSDLPLGFGDEPARGYSLAGLEADPALAYPADAPLGFEPVAEPAPSLPVGWSDALTTGHGGEVAQPPQPVAPVVEDRGLPDLDVGSPLLGGDFDLSDFDMGGDEPTPVAGPQMR